MPEPTLYLFDGYNLLHAGGFDDPRELVDQLASYVALQGARGIVVFDGVGADQDLGDLAVRFAPDADVLLERLSAEHRHQERVCLVTSDIAVQGTSGQEVRTVSSRIFLMDLTPVGRSDRPASRVRDHVDDETRAKLERMRRGQPQ